MKPFIYIYFEIPTYFLQEDLDSKKNTLTLNQFEKKPGIETFTLFEYLVVFIRHVCVTIRFCGVFHDEEAVPSSDSRVLVRLTCNITGTSE